MGIAFFKLQLNTSSPPLMGISFLGTDFKLKDNEIMSLSDIIFLNVTSLQSEWIKQSWSMWNKMTLLEDLLHNSNHNRANSE